MDEFSEGSVWMRTALAAEEILGPVMIERTGKQDWKNRLDSSSNQIWEAKVLDLGKGGGNDIIINY